MAEVHIIGQITQAKDFPKQSLFCKWYLQIGNNWKIISGRNEGQTQVSSSQFDNVCKWSFPIDIHLATAGVQGWPKIYLQVYHLDWLGRSHIFGYGFVTIPATPGTHILDCYTWRPFGSIKDRFVQYFLGGGFQIKNPDLIFSSGDRYKLSTEAMGVVSFELTVVLRNFTNYGVDANNSCSENTTATTASLLSNITSVTTANPLNSTSTLPPEKIPSPLPSTNKIKPSTTPNLCPCNLQIDYCDLDCCCDLDCSLEDKLVFDHCEEDFHHYDTRFCSYVKNVYVNFTVEERKIHQNGLFCILHANLPPNYLIQRKHPLKSFKEAEEQRVGKFSWPSLDENESISSFSRKRYTSGDSLWILTKNVYKNYTLNKFQFRRGFMSNSCTVKDDVKYLINIENSCKITEVNERNFNLHAENYSNMLIVAAPHRFNDSLLKNDGFNKICRDKVCLQVEAYFCDEENFKQCDLTSKSPLKIPLKCFSNQTSSSKTCFNLVQSVKYVFEHNATNGITKASVFLMQKNVTQPLILTQKFLVEFKWSNSSNNLNYSSKLSGNPGYLIGKPILTARLISRHIYATVKNSSNATDTDSNSVANKSSNFTQIVEISRNSSDFSSNFLVVFKAKSGKCALNSDEDKSAVEFGYNSYSKCKVEESLEISSSKNKNETISADYICKQVQQLIFKYWSIANLANQTLENLLIGQFGNANLNSRDQWSPILFEQDLKTIVNNTNGVFRDNYVICFNISTLLKIEFFHTRIDFDNVLNQEKILATTFQFGDLRKLEFSFSRKNEKVFRFGVGIGIGVQVSFSDITQPKVRKIVDPPSLNIKLPHDFFYPFVKLSSCASLNCCGSFLGLVVLVLVFCPF